MDDGARPDENAASVWPPPPAGQPGDTSPPPDRLEVARHLKLARRFLISGILLLAFLHIGTIHHGLQANRKGGRGEGTGYIVVGAGHLIIVAAVVLYSILSP